MGKRSRRADRAELLVQRLLDGLPRSPDLETVALALDDDRGPSAGSRPAVVGVDAAGRRYLFKVAPREHVAAEMFAYDVRALGRRATVPTAARSLSPTGTPSAHGMLQPLVEHAGERLPTDPMKWSELQREVLLREHPWEWLLANLDTHVDQYVLVGPDRVPLNIDWDHALEDLNIETLDRFTKRSFAIAPIRNALYDAYVRGDVNLELRGLRKQVRRIARLDDALLGRALEDWAVRASVEPSRARDVAQRFLARKRNIGPTFRSFLAQLRRERAARRIPTSMPLPARARIAANDAWQRLVIDSLHDRLVVPWLRFYRRVLALKARLGHSDVKPRT